MPHTFTGGGASLVPDISPGLNVFTKALESRRERQKETTKQESIQRQIDIFGQEGITPEQEEGALFRIGQLGGPQMANSFRQILERGDQRELAETQKITEQASRDAVFLQGIPDPLTRQQEIRKIVERQVAAGEDPTATVRLIDLTPEQQDLAFKKQIIQTGDFKTLLNNAQKTQEQFTPVIDSQGNIIGQESSLTGRVVADPRTAPQQEQFTPVLNEQGDVVGQRSSLTGKVVTDPRTPATTTPLTAIGKAKADLDAGNITPSEFKQITKAPTKEFKTSVGKLISDKKLAISLFGEDSPQVEAINAAITAESKGKSPSLTDIAGQRKEFTKLSGDFITIRDAFNKVQASTPTPQGDISLIFGFMKILDPGSVVREGEFATAENAAGVPERAAVQYNKLLRGDKLNDTQRAAFKSEAKTLFDTQVKSQIQLENSFRDLAERQNINPDEVVIKFRGEDVRQDETTQASTTPLESQTTVATRVFDESGTQIEGQRSIQSTNSNVPAGQTGTPEIRSTNPETGEISIFRNNQWQPL